MIKLKRTISLGLLLPTIILSFPIGIMNPCQHSTAMQQMTCCNTMVSSVESERETFTTSSCACRLSESQKTEVPLVNPAQIVKLNSKEIEKNFVNVSQWINKSILKHPFISTRFDVFFQPKFTLNLKIYDLVCSYLIWFSLLNFYFF